MQKKKIIDKQVKFHNVYAELWSRPRKVMEKMLILQIINMSGL